MRIAAVLLFALATSAAWSQQAISVRAGLVHYLEGTAHIDGTPIKMDRSKFSTVKDGGTLTTGDGMAEVLLADLGSPLHLAPASGVFLVGQLGKYLPGSVWSVVAQTEMAARLGVPRRRTGIVGLVTMALALLTGAAVGLPAIPLLLRRGGGDSVWFVAVAAALLVLAFWLG